MIYYKDNRNLRYRRWRGFKPHLFIDVKGYPMDLQLATWVKNKIKIQVSVIFL